MSLHYNGAKSYFYVNKTEICKSMVHNNIRWYEFCLTSVSKDFKKDEQSEISLNCTVCNFSTHFSSVGKEAILNIHEHLMIKNKIK